MIGAARDRRHAGRVRCWSTAPAGRCSTTPRWPTALRDGHLFAAGLDVFDVEPLPADHPLRARAERGHDPAPGRGEQGQAERAQRGSSPRRPPAGGAASRRSTAPTPTCSSRHGRPASDATDAAARPARPDRLARGEPLRRRRQRRRPHPDRRRAGPAARRGRARPRRRRHRRARPCAARGRPPPRRPRRWASRRGRRRPARGRASASSRAARSPRSPRRSRTAPRSSSGSAPTPSRTRSPGPSRRPRPPTGARGRCAPSAAGTPGGTVLVVAHNTLLRLGLCVLIGLPVARYRHVFPRLDNAAVTEIALHRRSRRGPPRCSRSTSRARRCGPRRIADRGAARYTSAPSVDLWRALTSMSRPGCRRRRPPADPRGWPGDGDRSRVGRLGGPARRGGRRGGTAVAPAGPSATDWPGVPDPDALRAQLADWLGQYANAGTRRTYAYALGLPVAWVDAIGGRSVHTARGTPPPAPRGPLHHLAWFRWCAHRALDPRAATGRDVKAWLHALDAAGASRRTRQRMLSTLSALYGHLTETGAVAANPAALHRGRLGLSSTARDASPTVRLTAAQLRALLLAAGGAAARPRPAAAPALRHPRGGVRRPAHPGPADLRAGRAGPRRPAPQRRRRRAARAGQGRAPPGGLRHRPRGHGPGRLPRRTRPHHRRRRARPARPHAGRRVTADRDPRRRPLLAGRPLHPAARASPPTPAPSWPASRTGCTRTPCATRT